MTVSAQGPSATTTSFASSGPSGVATRQPAPSRTCSSVAASPEIEPPAERLEIGEIGLVEAVRIADRPWIRPAQAAGQVGLDRRFHGLQFAARQLMMIDAEGRGQFFRILVGRVAVILGAEDLHPAVLADKVAGAGGLDQVVCVRRSNSRSAAHTSERCSDAG